MIRLRHADEWVGLLVVLAGLLFLGVVFQAGVLRDWFKPTVTLRIILPEAGVAGLAVGADVEVLGTKAGTIRRIVINPNQQMYAEAELDDQAKAFIRRDSQAVIKRRFGIAGASFVELSRGTERELDWSYAVVKGVTERDPTESIGAILDQVREKVFPILDDAGRMMRSLATVAERIEGGEGNIGKLLANDDLMKEVEGMAGDARAAVAGMTRILGQLEIAARDVAALTRAAGSRDEGVPALLRRTDRLLASLEGPIKDLGGASQHLPQIARNLEGSTQNLPVLLTQVQLTAQELERLLVQLRGSFLLGGGGPRAPDPPRLPPTQVRP
jgi:phospholipid/cholesterol/gamma-HCH transport system substrate-binding protein